MAVAQRLLGRSLAACSTSGGLALAGTRAASSSSAGSTGSALVERASKGDTPTITAPIGQAFPGDLRSTSGLGLGDGIKSHTDKWLQHDDKSPMTAKSPMEFIAETEPIEVQGNTVASYGSDDPGLGCPVEYINLKGTSRERPAVCKYTGNKYYSNAWRKYGVKE